MLPLILGLGGATLSADERDFFRDSRPAGYILFGRNVVAPDQLRALVAALRGLGDPAVPILVDQEGGRVVRLGPPHWPLFPAAATFGDIYARAPMRAIQAARLNGRAMGEMLRAEGIGATTAPILDIGDPDAHPVIGDRAFSSDPLAVAALGQGMRDGLAEAGIAAIVKHAPGHGRARVDSHQDCPVIDADAATLEADLGPFRSLAGAAAMMVAHIVYEAWDAKLPATLSPTVMSRILRGAIGFDGLLVSDDIAMGALAGPLPARAVAALAAGCDIVLLGTGRLEDSIAVAQAVPALGDKARARLTRLALAPPPATVDLADFIAARDALLGL